MRKRGKVDANQAEIVAALVKAGASVKSTAPLGAGFPDLAVGFHGKNFFFEIKTGAGTLTPDEQDFFCDWRGQVNLVRDVESALKVIGAI